jgi:hypothetical protein
MKFLVILGFLIGFGGVLTAAGFVPLASQERVVSQTSVANNGGRLENFIIRLPADRITTTGDQARPRLVLDPVTAVAAPADLATAGFMLEQFKLRNVDGDVIGTAMRHWTEADDASASTWSVSLPSRGTLVWVSEGNAPGRLSAALAAAGAVPGVAWEGELRVPLADDDNIGRVVTGTEEFAGSAGVVAEVWDVSGVGSNGELRGTISIETRVSRAQ